MNNWTRKNKRETFYVIRRGFEVCGMGYGEVLSVELV